MCYNKVCVTKGLQYTCMYIIFHHYGIVFKIMAKEVGDKLGGEWIHTQDDNFPPFFDVVGNNYFLHTG